MEKLYIFYYPFYCFGVGAFVFMFMEAFKALYVSFSAWFIGNDKFINIFVSF